MTYRDHAYRGFIIQRSRIVRAWEVRAPSGRAVIHAAKNLTEAKRGIDGYIKQPWGA